MNKTKFFFEKTRSSIKYLGIVAAIISLSVMFSSLCVMSLLSLSETLREALDDNPRATIGGDITITPMEQNEENFNLVKNKLEEMKRDGAIKEFTYTSVPINHRMYNLGFGKSRNILPVGYEDNRFPLEGTKKVLTPNISFRDLERIQDSAILSENLAKRGNLQIGDTFVIYSSDMYDMHQLKLIGITTSPLSSATNIYVNKNLFKGERAYTFYADIVGDDFDKIKFRIASIFPPDVGATVSFWDRNQAEKDSARGSIKVFTL